MLLVSLFLAFAMEPAANFLARRGWRRGLATATVFAVLVGVDQIVAAAVAAVPKRRKAASRSWITNRYASSPVEKLLNCCAVHSAVGCSVTFQCRIRRVPMFSTRNTYTTRKVAVTTTKKSHASVPWAWFRTNVLHVCDDEDGRDGTRRRMCRLTVRGETATPTFSSSSAAIRSSPQV